MDKLTLFDTWLVWVHRMCHLVYTANKPSDKGRIRNHSLGKEKRN